MRSNSRISRIGRWLTLVASGATMLGTSCAEEVRNSLASAGLDFVESAAGTLLEAVIPVDDLVGDE